MSPAPPPPDLALVACRVMEAEFAHLLPAASRVARATPGLLQARLAGEWNDARFLVAPTGHQIAFSADDRVVKSLPCPPA